MSPDHWPHQDPSNEGYKEMFSKDHLLYLTSPKENKQQRKHLPVKQWQYFCPAILAGYDMNTVFCSPYWSKYSPGANCLGNCSAIIIQCSNASYAKQNTAGYSWVFPYPTLSHHESPSEIPIEGTVSLGM